MVAKFNSIAALTTFGTAMLLVNHQQSVGWW
jgi:hypothetical protein